MTVLLNFRLVNTFVGASTGRDNVSLGALLKRAPSRGQTRHFRHNVWELAGRLGVMHS